MAPLRSISVPVLRQLADQARLSPPRVLRRHIDACLALARDIDPAQTYPADWITQRITGYRPDATDLDLVPGDALRAALPSFVEHLCQAAHLTLTDLDPAAHLDTDQLCARWHISPSTLARLRTRQGLIALRARDEAGRPRLRFPTAHADWFATQHPDRLTAAASFSRLSNAEADRLYARAHELMASGLSRTAAALRLATDTGRSHETIVQLLKRAAPVKPTRSPAATRRLIARAAARHIHPADIAARYHKSPSAVRDIARQAALAELRAADIPSPSPPPWHADPAETDRRLAHPLVATSLSLDAEPSAAAWLDAAAAQPPLPAADERAIASVYRFLLWRAHTGLSAAPASRIRAAQLDRLQCDLLWAALLRAKLLRAHRSLLAAAATERLSRPLRTLPPATLASLINALHIAAGPAIDRFDPASPGRLAAPLSLALARALPRLLQTGERSGFSSPRLLATPDLSRIKIAPWPHLTCPWASLVALPAAHISEIHHLSEAKQHLVQQRFALWGSPPITLRSLAGQQETSASALARSHRQAQHELRRWAASKTP